MIVRPTEDRGSFAGLTSRLTTHGLMICLVIALSACKTTEAKPTPSSDILIDPAAGDRYDSAIDGWGDRVRAAGIRLCRFFARIGMPDISCPK